MKKSKVIAGLLALFVSLPIWFYLVFKILQAVNASELMWFLFWIYLPVTILVKIIADLTES